MKTVLLTLSALFFAATANAQIENDQCGIKVAELEVEADMGEEISLEAAEDAVRLCEAYGAQEGYVEAVQTIRAGRNACQKSSDQMAQLYTAFCLKKLGSLAAHLMHQ